jgi:hypothetical protein
MRSADVLSIKPREIIAENLRKKALKGLMMNNKIKGIVATKPAPFYRRSISLNIRTVFRALFRAIAHLRSGNTDELASDAADAISGFGLSPSESDSAYQLITNSLHAATLNLARDNIHNLELVFDGKVGSLNNMLVSIFESSKITLDHNFLDNPCSLPVLNEIKPIYQQWLKGLGLPRNLANEITNRLDRYFVYALASEWRENRGSYQNLLLIVKTPFDAAEEREREWGDYFATLGEKTDENAFRAAFSTTATMENTINSQANAAKYDFGLSNLRPQRRHLVHLEQDLVNWLASRQTEDSVMILSGVPSTGGPAFMKTLCAKLYQRGLAKPIYIPVHLIDVQRDIADEVNRFLRDGGSLSFDPFDPNLQINDLLLVFDGLEKLTSDRAKHFVQSVERMVERRNVARCSLFVLLSESELAAHVN